MVLEVSAPLVAQRDFSTTIALMSFPVQRLQGIHGPEIPSQKLTVSSAVCSQFPISRLYVQVERRSPLQARSWGSISALRDVNKATGREGTPKARVET